MNRNEVKCRYLTIESHIGSRTTYGIAAVDANLGETAILESYVDVTCDEVQMENFTALCNSEGLDLLHLRDAVEDWIAEL